MKLHTRSSARHPRRAWQDVVWPVLAGSAVAAGVIGAYTVSNDVLGLIAFYVILTGIAAACMYCVSPEVAAPTSTIAGWVATGPLVVIAAFGLFSTCGAWGLLIALATAGTSPRALGRISRAAARWAPDRPARPHHPAPSPQSRLERRIVEQRFKEMVARYDEPGSTRDLEDDA